MPAHAETVAAATRLAHAVGLDVTHTHEELLFTKHNLFLLLIDDTSPRAVRLFFNVETPPQEAASLQIRLVQEAALRDVHLALSGLYRMAQQTDTTFSLELLPA